MDGAGVDLGVNLLALGISACMAWILVQIARETLGEAGEVNYSCKRCDYTVTHRGPKKDWCPHCGDRLKAWKGEGTEGVMVIPAITPPAEAAEEFASTLAGAIELGGSGWRRAVGELKGRVER